MDYLRIEGLRIETHIGVHAWEKTIKQVLLLDIELPKDLSQTKDTLKNTIDYDALCQHVTEFVESNAFNLIETVAHQVLKSIQKTFEHQAMTIRVSKPDAIHNAKNISFETSCVAS
ncbi:MAG: dihydroneopterin aldolase [Gammaproteobacteria bacterium]|nr:dihydroneopterin aldolase [Gammaproteobacteria bacterium]MCH9715516.1 dihydroneopterin aldolase [Gammaproteobacteria bacterium]MCH9764195.1 dihydroneopterin aldolase [Gammaproteobacteria bacterium]